MYQTPSSRRRVRINKHARDQLARLIVHYVGSLIGLTIVALFFSFIVINWLSGCGEQFPTADGSYIQGECIYPSDLWNDYRQSQSTVEVK